MTVKKIIAIFTVAALLLLNCGCVALTLMDMGVVGEGGIVSREFDAGNFDELVVGLGGNLYYTAGEPGSVRIETYENHMELIDVRNEDGNLYIGSDENLSLDYNDPAADGSYPKIYVSAPALHSLRGLGMVNFSDVGAITGESFTLDVSGTCAGSLELDVAKLDVSIDGVAGLELTGSAENAVIKNSGMGAVDALGLTTVNAEVDVEGMGSVEITCTGRLDASVEGMGSIRYRGDPQVTQEIDGMGSVGPADASY